MNDRQQIVSVIYYPRFFPCGPQSACCGPVGQTEKEVEDYVGQLRRALPDAAVRLVDATWPEQLETEPAAARLLGSFGPAACPIFTLDGQVVAMGPPRVEELAKAIKRRAGADE